MSETFGFLRASYLRRRRGRRGFLSTVALLDVFLLALVFGVVHAPFILQPGIAVQLPGSTFQTGASYSDMVVTLVNEDTVFFNDERTNLAGLGKLFAQVTSEKRDVGILLEADGRVKHHTLIRIYNMAREAGIEKITLATGLLTPEGGG